MMIVPLWAIAGLITAVMGAAMMLLQEKQKASGFAVAVLNKAVIVIILTVPALINGLPDQPHFYILCAVSAVIFAISDVIFFNLVTRSGAGVVSRVLPLNIVFIFIAWLFFDPLLVARYIANPWQTAGIVAAIMGAAISAAILKKCTFSWDAIKYGWFIILAGVMGSVVTKKAMFGIEPMKAALAYVPIQASMMLVCWIVFYAIKRPIPLKDFVSKQSLKAGGSIGVVTTIMVLCSVYGVAVAENPAYMSALFHLSSVFVIIYYRLTKHTENANVKAGMGIVFSAILLILLKSL
jgi:hypothetical protein